MFSNLDPKLLVLVMTSGGATQLFGLPSFLPVRLNDALSTMFLFLVIASCCLLIISRFHQNPSNNQSGFSPWISSIVNHIYVILIAVAVLGLATGAFFSPTKEDSISQQTPDQKIVVKAPEPVKIHKDAKTSQIKIDRIPRKPPKNNAIKPETSTPTPHRVFTPRTPKELMDIAEMETERDAMKHKGTWINVEGPVLDIGEAAVPYFSSFKKGESYIKIEVAIGPPTHRIYLKSINLYVKNDQWKEQVDKIRRGDWISAVAIVHRVYKGRIDVIDGDIVSVSGPDRRRK